jgi:hypothetical protein
MVWQRLLLLLIACCCFSVRAPKRAEKGPNWQLSNSVGLVNGDFRVRSARIFSAINLLLSAPTCRSLSALNLRGSR